MKNISIEEFLKKNVVSKLFDNNNYQSFLQKKKGCLNADGISDIRYTLGKYLDEFEEMETELFLSESLNPKKKYLPEEYFYEGTEAYKKIKDTFLDIIGKNDRIRFLRGARSIGKTLSQNYFLKKNDKKFENEKIFWVRCDCKKIIELLIDRDINIHEITNSTNIINDYLNIQFLYVFAKYYNDEERPFFRTIFENLKNTEIELRMNKDKFTAKGVGVNLEIIKEIHETIWHYKRTRADDSFHLGREVILGLGLKKENKATKALDKWKSISVQLQKEMKKQGYRFVKIVDGIDNYSKYNHEGEYDENYKFLLEKVSKFHIEYEKTDQKEKESVLVLLRGNTFYDYKICFHGRAKREGISGRIFSDEIKKNSIEINGKVLEERYKFIEKKHPNSYILKTFESITKSKTKNEYLNKFINENKHVGDFLKNNFNLIPALIFYKEKYDISTVNLLSFMENYQVVNLLLNGYFAIDSFNKETKFPIEDGKMLFNIFYYENTKSPNKKWQGLCVTRIIQHLKSKGSLTRQEIISDIKYLFNYDEFEINKKISKLLVHSIIKFDKEDDDENKENPDVILTGKGAATLDLIYSNIDILHHCALDAPIPVDLINNNLIVPHSNNETRNYAISCLKTSLTFIHYLKKIDRDEKRVLKRKSKSRCNIDDYILPLHDNLVMEYLNKRLLELFFSLKDEKLNEFYSYISDFSYEETISESQ